MEIKASAQYSVSVTPSDATSISCKALWIGVTCATLAIKHRAADSAVTYKNVPGGSILPVEIREGRVMSTGTSGPGAGDIIAMQW